MVERDYYISGKFGTIKTQGKTIIAKVYNRRDSKKPSKEYVIPIESIDVLVKAGRIEVSETAMRMIARRATLISLSYYGMRYAYHVPSHRRKNSAYAQIAAWRERKLYVAKLIELDLIDSLERHAEYHDFPLRLSDIKEKILEAKGRNELEAYEAEARKRYYKFYKRLVPEFPGRSRHRRHPPTDKINSLISLTNSALYSLTLANIIAVGLVEHIGFIHKNSSIALALDLAEPLKIIGFEFVYRYRNELEPIKVKLGKVEAYILRRDDLAEFYKKRKEFLSNITWRQKLSYKRYIKYYVRNFSSRLAEVL